MSDLTYQDVIRILGLIDGAKGSDIDLKAGDVSIKITRGAVRAPRDVAPREVTPSDAAPVEAEAPAARSQVVDDHPDADPVRAPMGGMFYAAPAPGQPPFATVGQAVKAGDQLGIIEVMKLFTPITAPVDGTLVRILVTDQQSVAKDEVLMRIDRGEG